MANLFKKDIELISSHNICYVESQDLSSKGEAPERASPIL